MEIKPPPQMFKKLLDHKLISAIFLLSFLFVSSGSLWAYFALRGINQPLILHFDDLAGITEVGGAISFLGAGALGALAVAVNFVLVLALEPRDKFFARLFAGATLFMSALLFTAFAAIVNIN